MHFTPEQMEWLQLVKDHIATSLSIQPEDLDLSPFDRKGGLGRFYEVFGEQYEVILMEMNRELVHKWIRKLHCRRTGKLRK